MVETIYIEEAVRSHPRTRRILSRYPNATTIAIDRYGEVFNRRGQDFRLQKQRPALILAEKFDHFTLPAPVGYGIGSNENYYFSHMLNCVYDCRYCFLQGMFLSAHYLLFVNFENFIDAIQERALRAESTPYFFSGYDCDSLAFDSTSEFTTTFLPWFANHPNAWLELRTKSVNISALRQRQAMENVVVAWSLSPEGQATELEHGAPSVQKRIAAMQTLADAGWKIGLRFDPLIYTTDFKQEYRRLFEWVFDAIAAQSVHSITLGPVRFPKSVLDRITKLHPDERLFASPFVQRGGMMSYTEEIETELIDYCTRELEKRISPQRIFPCLAAGAPNDAT